MKLEEIADVSIGILANREIVENGKYEYKMFHLKNYEEEQEYQIVRTQKDFSGKTTKQGDLLFRLVVPNKIIYVDKKQENLLVNSQLCIIRPDVTKISPIFLKWYLESQSGREKIMIEQKGSSIQKISVASLKKIEIPEVDRKEQEKIEDLIEIWEQEKQVMQSIIETKDMLYENMIEQIIEGGETFETISTI